MLNYWSNQIEKLIAAAKIFLLTWLIYAIWLKMQYMCKFMATFSLLIWKILSRENEVSVGSFSYVTHLVKSFISLVFTKSHLFLLAFIWVMTLICILVFNLECYEYFRPVFVEVLCHSFMRFEKVIFFPMKFYKKDLLAWKRLRRNVVEVLIMLLINNNLLHILIGY